MSAASCKNDTVPGPDRGLGYYPVAVNRFWVYSVADSSWSQATSAQPTSALQVSNYQFRETITDVLTDAAGQTAYRLVRAKRLTPTAAWVDDSVFTLTATSNFVVLNRSNLRTLELIFPVRDDKQVWNINAFNNNANDTARSPTRQYRDVGEPFTTKVGATSQMYPVTVTTTNEGSAKSDDVFYVKTYRQVFAKWVGPVLRQRRRFDNYYQNTSNGTTFFPNAYYFGFSRTETLVDYGPR